MELPKQVTRHLTTHYSNCLLFEPQARQKLDGLNLAACNPNQKSTASEAQTNSEGVNFAESQIHHKLTVADSMTCNCCQIDFADREEQLGHYKCDWHRYNLHLRLRDLPSVTEEEFENIAGDVSSISGSDDEDDNESALPSNIDLHSVKISLPDEQGKTVKQDRMFNKVFFKNRDGELISIYRCLLHHKKSPIYEAENLISAVNNLPRKSKWIILMVSAGHFAGAVFDGKQVLEHKTFHRYTIRAKRGTAQSSKDSQGNAPKSAGASLRRYNEAALAQEIQELLSSWTEHIKTCDFVFVRIPMANRGIFYGGKNPSLKKDDPRIRVIPFATRRPTFSETKRVQQMLASVECYGQETDVGDLIPLSPPRMYMHETGQLEVRDMTQSPKKSKIKNKSTAGKQKNARNNEENNGLASDQDNREPNVETTETDILEVDMDLVETMEEISFSDLKEFDHTPKKKRNKKKKDQPVQNHIFPCDVDVDAVTIRFKNRLFTACKSGDISSLQDILAEVLGDPSLMAENSIQDECVIDQSHQSSEVAKNMETNNTNSKETSNQNEVRVGIVANTDEITAEPGNKDSKAAEDLTPNSSTMCGNSSPLAKLLNTPLNADGKTFLHLASKEGHSEIVTVLLGAGADPSIKDKAGKAPYNLGEGEVRNSYRRFMADFPDKYDYVKAQVPSPLTAEMEAEKKRKAAEKRKEKKKAANERNKDKKAAEAKMREENREKDRFLALSDREKRALAAERRILQQHNDQGASKPVLSRCYQCGTDITGKVPFEYSDYKFCTTKCLREHRSKPTS